MGKQVEGQLTLFQGGFLANPFPLPGSSGARRMTASSGQKWLGLSRNSGPLGWLEKTLLESCAWNSPIYYLNWKPVGIGQGHFLFQLAVSGHGTGDTGSQLWATPTAMDGMKRRSAESMARLAGGARKGRRRPSNLREQADPVAAKMWPTPVASVRGDCPSERRRRSPCLASAVKMYHTPTAQDSNNSRLPPSQEGRNSLVADIIKEDAAREGDGSSVLNPDWVEWLMGFPPGWTDIGI